MLNVLKEYLVSLGFKVDASSLNTAQKAMRTAEVSVAQFSSSSLTSFAKASTGVIAFVATANLAIAKFVGGLAQASLGNEIFARRMWMNVDSARAYTSSINALGVSLQDLYLSPELMQKYLELNKLSRGMEVPGYDKTMKGVRDITFEFQKLRLEGTYALQWIGVYLTKFLAGPLGDLKKGMANINEMIQKNMPKWTEKVAMVVSWFVKMGLAAWKIRDALGAVILTFTAFKMVKMLSNPFGLMILGLTALLLLVDDFATYERGGDSAFPQLWKWVDKLGDSLNASGLSLGTFKKDLFDIVGDVGKLLSSLDKLAITLGAKGGLAEVIEKGIMFTLHGLDTLLKSIIADLDTLNNDIAGKPRPALPDKTYIPGTKIPLNTGQNELDEAKKIKDFFAGIGSFFGNMKSSLFGSGISPMSYNPKPPMPYNPKPNEQVSIDGSPAQTSFGKMQLGIDKMVKLMSYGSPLATGMGVGIGNSSPGLGYLYPQSSQSSGVPKITVSPVYHITSTDPAGVATQINRNNTSLITRTVQGVIR